MKIAVPCDVADWKVSLFTHIMKKRRKMDLAEVKKMAKALGVKVSRMGKLELIREIQKKEGNFPCFGTAAGYCDRLDCCFREDCLGKNY